MSSDWDWDWDSVPLGSWLCLLSIFALAFHSGVLAAALPGLTRTSCSLEPDGGFFSPSLPAKALHLPVDQPGGICSLGE